MIRLVIDFAVDDADAGPFEQMYARTYLPALAKQPGFEGSALLRTYPVEVLKEIGADIPAFNYQMTLDFASEQSRRDWVASPDHDPAWQQAVALSTARRHVGYELVARFGEE